MLKRQDIRIRDPFILTDKENKCYYMYGTTSLNDNTLVANNTWSVYKTYDLENFEEPKVIFDGDEINFWADRDFWAPEVHKYNGKYYLFGSCIKEGKNRASQIFVCDTPDGKYKPLTDKPVTPENWMCLDGTFYLENDIPYMIFSHEWVQVKNGEIWAQQLSKDLTDKVGEPFMLFKASDSPYVTEFPREGCYVTDGPFIFKEDGKLKMIWSSFNKGKYLVLEATANSIKDKWVHLPNKYDFDGGHAMIFYTLEGERMISLHAPNEVNLERAVFIKY